MKECDNSTRKIHISSNFILSICLIIMSSIRHSCYVLTKCKPTRLSKRSSNIKLRPPNPPVQWSAVITWGQTGRHEVNSRFSQYGECALRPTNSTLFPHSLFTCFVCISEPMANISPNRINWLVLIPETWRVCYAVRMEVINVIQVNFSLQSVEVSVSRANQFWDINALVFTSI
jgi:hypothetical protein